MNNVYYLLCFKAAQQQLFGPLHHWLILGSSFNATRELIHDEGFSPTTNFIIAIKQEIESEYTLYDAYNPCKLRGGKLNITFYGTWSEKFRLNVSLTMSKYIRRENLHQMKLSVGIMVSFYC